MKQRSLKELHDRPRFRDVLKKPYAYLHNRKGGFYRMRWDLNPQAKLDQIFELKAKCECGCEEQVVILVDYQELMHYGRAI